MQHDMKNLEKLVILKNWQKRDYHLKIDQNDTKLNKHGQKLPKYQNVKMSQEKPKLEKMAKCWKF